MDKEFNIKQVNTLEDLKDELKDYNWVVCLTANEARSKDFTALYYLKTNNIYIARLEGGLYERVKNKFIELNKKNVQR